MAVKNMLTYNKSAMHRPAYHWPYWLALIAVLWTSLSPALARVWADSATDRIEICTSTGVVWVSVEAHTDVATDADGAVSRLAATSMACEWCLLHGGAWDLFPIERVVPLVPLEARESAYELTTAVFDDELWWRPLSHAPPTLSLHLL